MQQRAAELVERPGQPHSRRPQRLTYERWLQVLGSLVAGVASLTAGKALADATPVDLFDDRNVRKKGFEIIYEARDLDLDQATRDGLSQFRGDLSATRDRYKEASKRIENSLGGYINKEYWCVTVWLPMRVCALWRLRNLVRQQEHAGCGHRSGSRCRCIAAKARSLAFAAM